MTKKMTEVVVMHEVAHALNLLASGKIKKAFITRQEDNNGVCIFEDKDLNESDWSMSAMHALVAEMAYSVSGDLDPRVRPAMYSLSGERILEMVSDSITGDRGEDFELYWKLNKSVPEVQQEAEQTWKLFATLAITESVRHWAREVADTVSIGKVIVMTPPDAAVLLMCRSPRLLVATDLSGRYTDFSQLLNI